MPYRTITINRMTSTPRPKNAVDAQQHVPELTTLRCAQKAIHGAGWIGRFNERIATSITDSVGTMWCAYAFAILALISLPDAILSENPITIVAWIAQTFLQLVLLPIIIVGQNIQAEHNDKRTKLDHQTLSSVHTLSTEIHQLTSLIQAELKMNHSGTRLEKIEQKISLLIEQSK